MIRQPDFVTKELFHYIINSVKQNKPNLHLTRSDLKRFQRGYVSKLCTMEAMKMNRKPLL